jgi:hypothetical protein
MSEITPAAKEWITDPVRKGCYVRRKIKRAPKHLQRLRFPPLDLPRDPASLMHHTLINLTLVALKFLPCCAENDNFAMVCA